MSFLFFLLPETAGMKMRERKNPEEKYFGLISVLFFLETRRKRNERAALQRWLQSPGTPWGAEARGKDGVRETLKQEVALSFCLHNEEKFYFYNLFSGAKKMSKIIFLTLGFSLKVKEIIIIKENLIWTSPMATRACWEGGGGGESIISSWGFCQLTHFLLEGADFTTIIFSSSSSSFFCLERNPLLAISLLVGGNSVSTGGNRARSAVHVSHWLSYILQLQWTDPVTEVERGFCCEIISIRFSGFLDSASQEPLRHSDYIFFRTKFRIQIKTKTTLSWILHLAKICLDGGWRWKNLADTLSSRKTIYSYERGGNGVRDSGKKKKFLSEIWLLIGIIAIW